MHGNNFGGFYFKAIIDALTKEGFRVVVPDQIGYGRSSKPIAPYNFNTQARNTSLLLQHLKIEKAMVTLSADWPRLAMVQALISQMLYQDPVVYDWAQGVK